MREHEHVTRLGEHGLDHATGSAGYFRKGLAALHAVFPYVPARAFEANLLGRAGFHLAVVPLGQIVTYASNVAEPREVTGLASSFEWAREHRPEIVAREPDSHLDGLGPALGQERDVGTASVTAGEAPLGGSVPDGDQTRAIVPGHSPI